MRLQLTPALKSKASTDTIVDYYVRQRSNDNEPEALVKNFRNQLPETERDIANLLRQVEEGVAHDDTVPNPVSVKHALSWAEQLYRDVRAELWLKPRVSADEDGEVVFEWWKGRKKLSVYISPTTAEYITVEKTGSSVTMEDGPVGMPTDRRRLWHWLTG